MTTYTIRQKEAKELRATSCRKLLGAEVINLQEKKLGEVRDIAIDSATGRIAYVVLSYSYLLGMRGKSFAIPWEAFAFRNREGFVTGKDRTMILNIPKEAIEESEGFDDEHWPKEPDYEWLERIYNHYGFRPYWERQ